LISYYKKIKIHLYMKQPWDFWLSWAITLYFTCYPLPLEFFTVRSKQKVMQDLIGKWTVLNLHFCWTCKRELGYASSDHIQFSYSPVFQFPSLMSVMWLNDNWTAWMKKKKKQNAHFNVHLLHHSLFSKQNNTILCNTPHIK
jgi:hypothetical protein